MCIKCGETMDLLTNEFGDELAEVILWNFTCYPFHGDKTLEQAKDIVNKSKTRPINEILEELDRETEEMMAKTAEI